MIMSLINFVCLLLQSAICSSLSMLGRWFLLFHSDTFVSECFCVCVWGRAIGIRDDYVYVVFFPVLVEKWTINSIYHHAVCSVWMESLAENYETRWTWLWAVSILQGWENVSHVRVRYGGNSLEKLHLIQKAVHFSVSLCFTRKFVVNSSQSGNVEHWQTKTCFLHTRKQ